MAYPNDIDEFREIENLPGLEYDAEDKRTFFVEDLQAVRDSITAIETVLGTNPAGLFETVKAALGLKVAVRTFNIGDNGEHSIGGLTFKPQLIVTFWLTPNSASNASGSIGVYGEGVQYTQGHNRTSDGQRRWSSDSHFASTGSVGAGMTNNATVDQINDDGFDYTVGGGGGNHDTVCIILG